MTFAEIEPSFIGDGMEIDNCIIVRNEAIGELLRITPNGEVIAPTLESAGEAGRIFVEAIRGQLKELPLLQ